MNVTLNDLPALTVAGAEMPEMRAEQVKTRKSNEMKYVTTEEERIVELERGLEQVDET